MGNQISRICACNCDNQPQIETTFPKKEDAKKSDDVKQLDFYDYEDNPALVLHSWKKIQKAKSANVLEDDRMNPKASHVNSVLQTNTTENPITNILNQVGSVNSNETLIFEGETLNHKKNGRGILKNHQGEIIYSGHFKNDVFHGKGTLVLNNHDIYEGQFEEGKRNGFGTLISSDKRYRFDGFWGNDLKEGKGYEEVKDMFVYDGDFKEGKKQGNGIYTFSNGSYYEGTFENDKLHGKGKYYWNEKRIYEGDWSDNFIDGFGILYDSGKIYIGYFEKDKRNGKGLYINKDNNILVGKFLNNELNGYGLMISYKGEDFCNFTKGKKVEISDENMIVNFKEMDEYKELKEFYESNKDLIKKYKFF